MSVSPPNPFATAYPAPSGLSGTHRTPSPARSVPTSRSPEIGNRDNVDHSSDTHVTADTHDTAHIHDQDVESARIIEEIPGLEDATDHSLPAEPGLSLAHKIIEAEYKDSILPVVDASLDHLSSSATSPVDSESPPRARIPDRSPAPTDSASMPATPSALQSTPPSEAHSSVTAIAASPSSTVHNQAATEARQNRRRSTADTRASHRFSGFISNLIHRRPDREANPSSRQPARERDPSPPPGKTASRSSTPSPSLPSARPVTPPPSLPPPTLQELGLSLMPVTSVLTPSHFNTPPTSGTFLAPHYLLLCHAQGLDVLSLVSPPAPQPYALVRRVSFKSVVVMEERGVLVAIAGRRDGVRVYALEEVKKAVEWRVEVEVRRERERLRREEAKRGVSGGVDKVFGELRVSDKMDEDTKAQLSTPPSAMHASPKLKRRKSSPASKHDAPAPPPPRPRPPTTRKVKTPRTSTPPTRDITDPPPSYTSSPPAWPGLRTQPSAISISQTRTRSGSVTNVLAGSVDRRRSAISHREGDEKGDWVDEHGSSDDEAINLATAGPSGSAALDERTSAMATASSAASVTGGGTQAGVGSATLDIPVPDGLRRTQTALAAIPSMNRRRRPSHLDLTRSATAAIIPVPPPSPTPTIWTLRQALASPPPDENPRSGYSDADGEGEGEEDEDGTAGGEPITFAQALLESRLPDLPPPGTRRPQQPILLSASHPIATGDDEPASPRETASDAHTVGPGSSRRVPPSRRRHRWSVLDGIFSPVPAAEGSQSPRRPEAAAVPQMREQPQRALARSQSSGSHPSPARTRTPLRRPSSSPTDAPLNASIAATAPQLQPPPLPISPPNTPSSHRFLPRIITNAFQSRRSDDNSSPSTRTSGGELPKRPSGSSLAPQAPAPKLEYVKLPGTKGSVLIKAVETSKKSFLAILCGEAGEKVELFAGTYRTTLGLSRTFILPDSPRSLELQLQGDDLVEVFLVFSQNVFGLEPATVRVREVRVGRAERRAARRRARENRADEPGETDAPLLGDDETNVSVSVGVALSTSESATAPGDPPPSPPSNGQTSDTNTTTDPTPSASAGTSSDELAALAAAHMGPYTTFQQLSFAPQFPLAAIADECIVPPTYPSFLQYRAEHETEVNGIISQELSNVQLSPPGLPAPITLPPSKWYYRDPKGVIQGPWKASLMQSWYKDHLLPPDLPVRREEDSEYILLRDLRLQCVDPAHPFRPPPPPLNSPLFPVSDPVKPLLAPISLLCQPKHYGPPGLFFSTRGGHSTAIVDARGRPVLKGRFMWTVDEDDEQNLTVGRLGDVKRLEAFDINDRSVVVAVRQGGLEIVDIADALLKPADESRPIFPNFNPPVTNTSRRGPFIWRIGSPLSPAPVGHHTSLTVQTPGKKISAAVGKSPAKSEFPIGNDDPESRLQDELLFLGRQEERLFFCERSTGSFRIVRLCPIPQ